MQTRSLGRSTLEAVLCTSHCSASIGTGVRGSTLSEAVIDPWGQGCGLHVSSPPDSCLLVEASIDDCCLEPWFH